MPDPPVMLPSEVARLVYGYLESCECPTVAKKLLETSPNLDECRQRVAEVGKADFLTRPFWLSMEEMLELYFDVSDIVFSQMSLVIPNIKKKYSNPIDALEFLLSLDEQTMRGHPTEDISSNYSEKNNFSDKETCSNISLSLGLSPDRTLETSEKRNDTSESTSCTPNAKRKNYKLKTEDLDDVLVRNSCSKPQRRVRVLKPKTVPVSSRTKKKNTNKTELVFSKATSCVSNDISSSPEVFKDLKMSEITPSNSIHETRVELRRSTRKRSGSLFSPETENGKEKTPKLVNDDKENDTQPYLSRIPQILMNGPWPELIAENINKKMLESPDTSVEDRSNIIESIAEKTLDDESCDELIREIFNNVLQEDRSSSKEREKDPEIQNNYLNDERVNELSRDVEMKDANNDQECSISTKLQADMSEFIQFNQNAATIEESSSVIILDVPQLNESNLPPIGNYIVNDDQSVTPIGFSDIVTVGNNSEMRNSLQHSSFQWLTSQNMLGSSASMSTIVTNNAIIGPVRRNQYRAIAPKEAIQESYIEVSNPSPRKDSSRKSCINNLTTQTRSSQRTKP